jgi:FdhE protein
MNSPAIAPTNAVVRFDKLAEAHPEWAPWLRVLRELAPGLSDPGWDACAPPITVQGAPGLAPVLAGARMQPDGHALARVWARLQGVARAQGLQGMAGDGARAAPPGGDASADALAVFLAALNHDQEALDAQASRAGASPQGWRTLAQLLPMPYLHA